MNDVLGETLKRLEIGPFVCRGSLCLFPLGGGPSHEDNLALLEEALEEKTLRVEELSEGGSVPELRIINGGTKPVLVLEGDELVGAKQNRVVNSSVLVAAGSELVLPVSCVERGRWSRRPKAFSSGSGSPHLALRKLKSHAVHDSLRRGRGHRSNQGAVWAEVDRVAHLHDAVSPTDALQDTRARLAEKLKAFEKLSSEIPEGTRGVIVVLGSRPILVEVLAGPRSFARVSRKLLSGYALEALGQEAGGVPDPSAAKAFFESVSKIQCEEHPAVGLGRDVRLRADGITGYALVGESGVLHAAAFAD